MKAFKYLAIILEAALVAMVAGCSSDPPKDGGQILGPSLDGPVVDAEVRNCPIHGDLLLVGTAPLVPGGLRSSGIPYPGKPKCEWEIEAEEFPYAHAQFETGCCW